MKMSTQVDLFTNVEPTSVSPAIAKPFVSRSTFYQGDCLVESQNIENGSVDLILTDLPYGIMQPNHNGIAYKKMYKDNLKWDFAIEPNLIYEIANRILRKNGKMILFTQEPYTSKLVTNAIANIPYSFKMIWEKNTFGSHLKCNIAPLGYFEEILVFSKKECYEAKHPLRSIMLEYVKTYSKEYIIDLFLKEGRYTSELSARVHASYKFGFNDGMRFDLMNEKMYLYLADFIEFEHTYKWLQSIDFEYKTKYLSTFNLWEGNKYKSNILKHKKDYDGYHPTQKPVLLLEDLIKTFSNENDLVVDLTMGSGSTGVACRNTNRHFIGIEKDEKYFEIAVSRVSAYCG
jgi:site-specific DNA-methyltransferase (adenine-specific)